MDRAKETIIKAFPNEERYKKIFEIIDQRWDCQLHQPLHAAAHMLNPQFFYGKNDSLDGEVGDGFVAAVERLVRGEENQIKITCELDAYRRATNAFGSNLAIKQRATLSPVAWWHTFGSSTPNLQKFAITVLSLTCSSSGCERNWSIFENVHAKRRNMLEQQQIKDSVYVKYNRALQRRYDARDTIDPISLMEIDDCNEWLTGIIDEDWGDALVFKDNFSWDVVEKVLELDQPAYSTKKKKSTTATPTSSIRLISTTWKDQMDKGKKDEGSSLRLLDEDEDIEIDFECEGDEEEEFDEMDDQFEEEEEEEEDEEEEDEEEEN